MRKIFSGFFLIVFVFTSLVLKAEPKRNISKITTNTTESLFNGLNSENLGLKTGSAYMLGELNIRSAVVPLMKMMRNDESDEAKIVAALALYKLGTPMSIYALFQATKYEESERVRKICSGFYLDYISKHRTNKI